MEANLDWRSSQVQTTAPGLTRLVSVSSEEWSCRLKTAEQALLMYNFIKPKTFNKQFSYVIYTISMEFTAG